MKYLILAVIVGLLSFYFIVRPILEIIDAKLMENINPPSKMITIKIVGDK